MARIVRAFQDPITNARLHAPGEEPPLRFDDLGFRCDYEAVVEKASGKGMDGALVLPPSTSVGMRARCEGLVVRVAPRSGPAWKAAFFGNYAFDGFPEGAFGSPDPDHLLVATGGRAFRVPVADPSGCLCLSAYFMSLAADAKLGVVAIADHDTVLGLRAGGGTWETPRLSMCCLRFRVVEGTLLKGEAVSTASREVPFEVDLRDGASRGGWEETLRP